MEVPEGAPTLTRDAEGHLRRTYKGSWGSKMVDDYAWTEPVQASSLEEALRILSARHPGLKVQVKNQAGEILVWVPC